MIPSALLETALIASQDGVVIAEERHSKDRPIVYVNPAFIALTGYAYAEILGQDCRFLNRHARDQNALDTVRTSLRTGKPCRAVLLNHRKNGEPFWNELSLSPVHNALGIVTHVIGIQKDVTHQVRQRQEIERQRLLLIEKNTQLEELVTRDALTQLHNRRYFEDNLARAWDIHLRLQTPLAVIFVDIDHFKRYNDYYGHLEGDQAIRQVAQLIRRQFSGETNLVARYGGEEFVIVTPISLQGATEANGFLALQQQAEALCAAIASLRIPHIDSPTAAYLTVSIGMCWGIPQQGENPSRFTREADQAMYAAKKLGGNLCMAHQKV